MLVTQSCPTLCNPMDCSPPGSSVREIFQAKILEWVAIYMLIIAHKNKLYLQESKSVEFSSQGKIFVFCLFIIYMKWVMFTKVIRIIISFHNLFTVNHCTVYLKLIQCILSHSVISPLCDSMHYSSPGFPNGIFQARILEWVAISLSRGSSQPRDRTCASGISCIERQFLYHWEALNLYSSVCQFYLSKTRRKKIQHFSNVGTTWYISFWFIIMAMESQECRFP